MPDPRRKALSMSDLPQEAWELYGYLVQTIAGADGELSPAERALLYSDGVKLGVSNSIIESWAAFDWTSASLKALATKLKPYLTPPLAARVIYNAMRIALADGGYAIEERSAVDEAAALIGVDQEKVQSLLGLVELELAVTTLRRGLQVD